ncbi:hypothetical protein [Falsiroseomonas sp.]|uniref:hypothetical protein n=1 Tax=Falsiroseomonas sp. TaxID=2870721 RepID=UPI0035681F27
MTDDLPDLSPDRAPLIDAALERRHALRLGEDVAPLLAALPAEAQPFGEFLLAEMARQAARLDALEDAQRAAMLSREERMRLDPLRFIPKSRLGAALGPAEEPIEGPVALDAGAPDFVGFGWWQAERTEGGSLRWSGASRCATLLLPALGGGELVLTLCLRAPFGLPLDIGEHDLFLDGAPLAFHTVANDGVVGIFEAALTLPEMPASARLTLLLHGPQHDDPAVGPKRDTRRIGLGLIWARIERA